MLKLAMDKSLRTVDKFGRMYVQMSNISKSIVNPYRGNEIPNGEALGLDMEKVYMLLRHPDELKKAADTFNNIPLLDRHIPVTADAPSKEFIVGSTGTDAVFDEPFLRNSLVIWCANAIAGINTEKQRELSSAYSYDADMTPGNYEGVAYDGIMRNIKGNHVALVEAGRAGPDVIVGDSKLLENPKMKVGKLSAARKKALSTILTVVVAPQLAQDAQIADLTAIAGSVDSVKTAKDKQAVVTAIRKHYGDKLAEDANLDSVITLLDALAEEPTAALDEDDEELDADGNPKKKKVVAEDEEDPPAKKDDSNKVDKHAMDAAIAATRADTIREMNEIHQAVRDVEPFIGTLAIAQDSAANVYKLALDAAKVDLTGVHPSAYKAMVGMLPKAGTQTPVRTTLAQDGAITATDFAKLFPNASNMKGGV